MGITPGAVAPVTRPAIQLPGIAPAPAAGSKTKIKTKK